MRYYPYYYRRPSFVFGALAGMTLFLLVSALLQMPVLLIWVVGVVIAVTLIVFIWLAISGARHMRQVEKEYAERQDHDALMRRRRRDDERTLNIHRASEKAIGHRRDP